MAHLPFTSSNTQQNQNTSSHQVGISWVTTSCLQVLWRGLPLGRGSGLLRWECLCLAGTRGCLLLADATRAGLLQNGGYVLDSRGSLLGLGGLGLWCSLSRRVSLWLRSSLSLGCGLGLGGFRGSSLLGGGLSLGDLGLGLGLLLLEGVSDEQAQ